MSGRRAIVAAGIVIAALIAVLAWKSRGGDEPAARTSQVAAPEPAKATEPAPAARAPVAPVAPVAAVASGDEEQRPQPVPLPPGANPPPLDGKRSDPAPAQKAFTPAETIAKREADLKMLDDTKARLEADLAAAKAAHDATAVHDLEIRIARLADVRKKRSAELDQLRAGGSATP
jgi:hypothetical protein